MTNGVEGVRVRRVAYPYVDLAEVLIRKEKLDEAIAELEHAARVEPGYPRTYYDLGLAWATRGDRTRAVEYYHKAVSLDPDYAEAHNNLGRLLDQAGDATGAIRHFRAAVRAKPDHGSAHFNLARALNRAGQLAEAARHFRLGLKLQPDRVDAMVELSKVLARLDRSGEATETLRRALAVEPDNVAILVGLARILATFPDPAVRNGPDAVTHARRACELTGWAEPAPLLVLADAYAEAGQQQQALDTLQKLRALATTTGDAELQGEVEQRLRELQERRRARP